METYDIITYVLIGLGMITFFLAIKPPKKVVRLKGIFWILGNAFFIAQVVYKYWVVHSISYTIIMLLVFVNLGIATYLNKTKIDDSTL